MELYAKQKQKCIDTQMLSKFLIAKSYFMYPKAKTALLEHSQFGSYIKLTSTQIGLTYCEKKFEIRG